MEVLTRNWVRAFFDLDMDQMYAKNLTQSALQSQMGQIYVKNSIQMGRREVSSRFGLHDIANRTLSEGYGPVIFQAGLPVFEQIDGAEYNMRQTKSKNAGCCDLISASQKSCTRSSNYGPQYGGYHPFTHSKHSLTVV